MAYTALQVANTLLQRAINTDDSGELMTNMKLQKMLYYEQGFHLAYFGTPLFDEDIEAWQYGPVVPSVYRHFKRFGRNGLEPDGDGVATFANSRERRLFDIVFDTYNKYSAVGLMDMTHNEKPWRMAGEPMQGNIISQESMQKFFKTRLS